MQDRLHVGLVILNKPLSLELSDLHEREKKIRTHLNIFWTVIGAQTTEHCREKEMKTEKES